MSVANQRRNIRRLGWMAWGGSLLRDARFACRSLRRAPFVAVTIVLTVGLGLGLVAAVFTMLNAVVFQTDAVPDPESLYAVVRPAPADVPSAPFTRAEYETLLRETEAFVDAFAAGPSMELVIDGERMEGTFVSGNFFEVLGVSAAHGRALTPADERNGERTIVLSHRAWSRYFGSDAGVLSRTVDVNGAAFQVVGVTPQAFRGLATVPPDFWCRSRFSASSAAAASAANCPLSSGGCSRALRPVRRSRSASPGTSGVRPKRRPSGRQRTSCSSRGEGRCRLRAIPSRYSCRSSSRSA